MSCWWERRGGRWEDFDPEPRRSYYKFLRSVYGMGALEAWSFSRRIVAIENLSP